jgi:hypothetical protein
VRFVFLLAALAVSGVLAVIPCAQTASAPKDDPRVHLLVDTSGEVLLKREKWKSFAVATAPVRVRDNDSIRLAPGASAKVVCSDLTVRPLAPATQSGVPCGAQTGVIQYKGTLLAGVRGSGDNRIPIVLAPRRTGVRPANIRLRWMPVAGVHRYYVEVVGPGVNGPPWAVIDRTEFDYSAGKKLSPRQNYSVIITAELSPDNIRSSREEGIQDLAFWVLSSDDNAKLMNYEKQIRRLPVGENSKRFLTASLLTGWNLRSEAIDRLDKLFAEQPSPAVARLLGQLYHEQALYRLAESWYLRAFTLSRDIQDIEGEASAANRLAVIYAFLGNAQKEAENRELSKQLYRQLGPDAADLR